MQGGKRSNLDTPARLGMPESHPAAEVLERYLRGELGREPRRALEAHLASCPACQRAVDALPVPAGPVRWQAHRFAARRLARELAQKNDAATRENLDGVLGALGPIIAAVSRGELAELLGADELRRRALIRREPRFRSLALCALLEARCRAVWLDDPQEAVESAKLAVLIAERLAADGGAEPVADARAMALMHLGNACRVAAEQRLRLPAEVVDAAPDAAPERSGERPTRGGGSLENAAEMSGSSWEAEAALWELRDAYLARGMALDAALVCLDLAGAFLRDGRQAELRRMVAESVPLFAARGADPVVVDALRFLGDERARAGRPLTLDLLDKMARFLQEARHDPRREASREG
jgi:hypothetical protein